MHTAASVADPCQCQPVQQHGECCEHSSLPTERNSASGTWRADWVVDCQPHRSWSLHLRNCLSQRKPPAPTPIMPGSNRQEDARARQLQRTTKQASAARRDSNQSHVSLNVWKAVAGNGVAAVAYVQGVDRCLPRSDDNRIERSGPTHMNQGPKWGQRLAPSFPVTQLPAKLGKHSGRCHRTCPGNQSSTSQSLRLTFAGTPGRTAPHRAHRLWCT